MSLRPDLLIDPIAYNADGADINTIPVAAPPASEGRLSLEIGFDPITRQPIVSGGLPPKMQDFNGVLKLLSSFQVFWEAGGFPKWDATIKKIEAGNIVEGDTDSELYYCIQENGANTIAGAVNPETDASQSYFIKSTIKIATQTEVNTGIENRKIVTPLTFYNSVAAESKRGVIQIATSSEAAAGTDDTKAITPLKLAERSGVGFPGDEINLPYVPTAQQMLDRRILPRNGASLLRVDYPALFNVIGTIYGAADIDHFNLPDDRGLFPRFMDDGAGVDDDAAIRTNRGDGVTGDNVGTKQSDAMQRITGNWIAAGPVGFSNIIANGVFSPNGAAVLAFDGAAASATGIGFDSADSINPNIAKSSDYQTHPKNIYKWGGIHY